MADRPESLRIRSYNVGFGDCFLLTFFYGDADAPGTETRNVLIDFGSTKLARSSPEGLVAVAEQIREDCGGKLHIVVATHRHADHISGFGGESGEVIVSLKPDLVVQPWTEDPNIDPEASAPPTSDGGQLRARAFAARLSDMQALAAAALAEVDKLAAVPGVTKTLTEQLRFLGETNIKNEPAVRTLMELSKRRVYASFGTKLPIDDLLPGVQVDVLGPPTLAESSAIREQRSRDEDEFWHLAARGAEATTLADQPVPPIFPDAPKAEQRPQEARWVIPKIDEMVAEERLAIVRVLDSVLNNTSLILLFTVNKKSLLFPGDAQIENWSYALFDAPGHEDIVKRLADVRFYKVGHHGSLNATPKAGLYRKFKRLNEDPTADRLITMVSTLHGKHGSDARGTEVPRSVLIDELKKTSTLLNTQDLKTKQQFWNDVRIDF